MGTSPQPTSEALKAAIEKAFTVMGLSQRQGAYLLFDVLHPGSEDDLEAGRFADAFKKQMARPTTSPETLERYLVALQGLDEFKRADLHYLRPARSEHIPDELRRELQILSKEVHALVKARRK
ncbi:MAG: hypothetical protein K0Q68_2159 [Moraxellaceae bacterium]|jgi:hypothetical protein|nr:hypothetical protein [Moraxellaceae bacterium]